MISRGNGFVVVTRDEFRFVGFTVVTRNEFRFVPETIGRSLKYYPGLVAWTSVDSSPEQCTLVVALKSAGRTVFAGEYCHYREIGPDFGKSSGHSPPIREVLAILHVFEKVLATLHLLGKVLNPTGYESAVCSHSRKLKYGDNCKSHLLWLDVVWPPRRSED